MPQLTKPSCPTRLPPRCSHTTPACLSPAGFRPSLFSVPEQHRHSEKQLSRTRPWVNTRPTFYPSKPSKPPLLPLSRGERHEGTCWKGADTACRRLCCPAAPAAPGARAGLASAQSWWSGAFSVCQLGKRFGETALGPPPGYVVSAALLPTSESHWFSHLYTHQASAEHGSFLAQQQEYSKCKPH